MVSCHGPERRHEMNHPVDKNVNAIDKNTIADGIELARIRRDVAALAFYLGFGLLCIVLGTIFG